MKFIEFISVNGEDIYINPASIVMIKPNQKYEDYTVYEVYLDTDMDVFMFLRGDPDLIDKLTAGEY